MMEYIFYEILEKILPIAWPLVSFWIFGKKTFIYLKNKYYELELYEVDSDAKLSCIAYIATVVSTLIAVLNVTSCAEIWANQLSSNLVIVLLLSYVLRWLIAGAFDSIICVLAWYIYQNSHNKEKFYA